MSRTWKLRPSLAALTLVAATGWLGSNARAQETASKTAWIPLFNGKNLDGWTPKITGHDLGVNAHDTFRVENGLLRVAYDKYDGPFNGQFGHLFYKQPYGHYRLRIEYRFVGDQCPGGPGWAIRNSGVMIHGQSPETMRKDQEFPVSIEVQFLGGTGTGKRPTANLCTPGTNAVVDGKLLAPHCTDSRSDTYNGDQWVTVEVDVDGDKVIRHLVNGKEVLAYEKPQLDPNDPDGKRMIEAHNGDIRLTSGTLSLQSESHPVEFRKVEILPLDPTPAP